MEPQEGRPPDESGVGGGARAETPSSSPPAPSPTSPAGSTGGSASGFNTRGLAREEVSKLLLRKLSGDVEDGFEPLGPIATASNLPAVYQALAVVDTPVQLEVLSCLVVASTHSKSNREMISKNTTFDKLLAVEHKAKDPVVTSKIFQLIEILGSHSIRVKDLRALLVTMRSDHPHFSPHKSLQILNSLQTTTERTGPEVYFHFTGDTSSIVVPAMKRWPHATGFSVALWLCLDDRRDPASLPCLYSFRAASGLGYSAHVNEASLLVLTTYDSSGKAVCEHTSNCSVTPGCWRLVTVSYAYSRLRKSTVTCYLDGAATDARPYKLLATSAPFTRCFLGSSGTADEGAYLRGDLGAFYLFEREISAAAVQTLHGLGPGYFRNFSHIVERGFAEDSPGTRELQTLQDAMICNYNPMACEDEKCMESSPSGLQYFVHSPHATMLSGVSALTTGQIQEALRANGGVQVLLPLFSQFNDATADRGGELPLVSALLGLICSLVSHYPVVQQQMTRIQGFLLLGFLLQHVAPQQLDARVVSILLDTAVRLNTGKGPTVGSLLTRLLTHVLLNEGVWSRAAAAVRVLLYTRCAGFLPSMSGPDARQALGVPVILKLLRLIHTSRLELLTEVTAGGGTGSDSTGTRGATADAAEGGVAGEGRGVDSAAESRGGAVGDVDPVGGDGSDGAGAEVEKPGPGNDTLIRGALSPGDGTVGNLPSERSSIEAVVGALAKSFSTAEAPPSQTELDAIFEYARFLFTHGDTPSSLSYLDFVEAILMHRGWRAGQEASGVAGVHRHALSTLAELLDGAMDPDLQVRLIGVIGKVFKTAVHGALLEDAHQGAICELLRRALAGRVSPGHAGALTELMYREGAPPGAQIPIQRGQIPIHRGSPERGNGRVVVGAGTRMVLSLVADECLERNTDTFVFAEIVLHTLLGLLGDPHNCGVIAADHRQILYHLTAIYHAAVASQTRAEATREISASQSRAKLVETRADSDTIDLSENCISLLCSHALESVQGGWAWCCDLDVMLREWFLSGSVEGGDSVAGRPSFTFVSLLFSKAMLGHVCSRIDEWTASRRPFLTILSAKENAKFLNNLCLFLAMLLPQLLRATSGLDKLLLYFHGEEPTSPGPHKKSSLGSPSSWSPIRRFRLSAAGQPPPPGGDPLEPAATGLAAGASAEAAEAASTEGAPSGEGACAVGASEEADSESRPSGEGASAESHTQDGGGGGGSQKSIPPPLNLSDESPASATAASISPDENGAAAPATPELAHDGQGSEGGQGGVAEKRAHEKEMLTPLVASIQKEVLRVLQLLLSMSKFTETIDGSTKAALVAEGFWENCICLICANIIARRGRSGVDLEVGEGEAHDAVATSTELEVLDLCLARCAVPNPLGILAFALVAVTVVDAYKAALQDGVSSLDSVLGLSVRFLQGVAKGPWGHHLDTTIISSSPTETSSIFKSNAEYWKVGASVTALVMLVADSVWEEKLRIVGQGAIANIVQKEFSRQEHRLQRLQAAAAGIETALVSSPQSERALWSAAHRDAPADPVFDLSLDLETEANERARITAMSMWRRVLASVTNERGVWSPASILQDRDPRSQSPGAVFWRLDDTEDGSRQRLRMVRNEYGSSRPEATLDEGATAAAGETSPRKTAERGAEWYAQVQQSLGFKLPVGPQMDASAAATADDGADSDAEESLHDTSSVSINPLDEAPGSEDQRMVFAERCTLVRPGHQVAGQLFIFDQEFFFSVDTSSDTYQGSPPAVRAFFDTLNGKWTGFEVAGALPRRFLLQRTALEVFLKDRTSLFLSFPTPQLAKKALSAIPVLEDTPGFFFGMNLLFSRRMRPEALMRAGTARWVAGDMSNFDYLMLINTVAGRTYNDLSQYPVFPWVLSNYTSDTLDLTDPANYRDLTKPVGALNPDRLEEFVDRYADWDEEEMGAPAFHYGSHYSTPAYVLFWLLRVEPFSGLMLDLHEGKFDHPDRLFHSIASAWDNCLMTSSDVKELVPELFYLPEALRNDNHFGLGRQLDGTPVDNVELPRWAASPEDFVRKHREALESPHVTEHLPAWIDLIFGCKQRGPAAAEAANVFYHLSYEGAVDIEALDDGLRASVLDQIRDFGQTPQQLFKRPHPQRSGRIATPTAGGAEARAPSPKSPRNRSGSLSRFGVGPRRSVSTPAKPSVKGSPLALAVPQGAVPQGGSPRDRTNSYVRRNSSGVFEVMVTEASASPMPERKGKVGSDLAVVTPDSPVTFVRPHLDSVVTVSCNQHLVLHRLAGGRLEPRGHRKVPAETQLGEPFDEKTTISSACFSTVPDTKVIFACGFWDSSLRCFTLEGRQLQSVYGHARVLSCLDLSRTGRVVATGSRDATVCVWHYRRNPFRLETAPRATLVGHESAVTCVAVNASLDTVVSGSVDSCLVHKLSGDLVRVIAHGSARRPGMLRFCGTDGRLAVYYRDKSRPLLTLYTLNGRVVREVEVDEQLMDMAVSPDGEALATGGFARQIRVWTTAGLVQTNAQGAGAASIRALSFSHDGQWIIAGLASGHVAVRPA